MQPKISIIVPVYKVEPYLRQCLDSLVGQTFQDIEILMIDDGSPDNCGAICDEYAQKDARVRVFHIENHGVSYARNLGIEHAQGEWICFVDSDDWADTTMLEQVYPIAEKYHADHVMWNYYEELPNQQIVGRSVSQSVHCLTEQELQEHRMRAIDYGAEQSGFYWSGVAYPWCKLYRAELVKTNHVHFPLKVHPSEDIYFNYIYLEYAKKVVFINKPLFHYRRNQESSLRKWNSEDKIFHDNKTVLDAIEAFHQEHPSEDPQRLRQAMYGRWVDGYVAMLTRTYVHKDSPYSFRQTLKRMKKQLNIPEYYEAFHNIDIQLMTPKRKWIICFGRLKWTLFLYLLGWIKQNTVLKREREKPKEEA